MQRRSLMELINLWLPLIGVGVSITIAASAWFAGQKILGIWLGFFGGVCLLLLAALQVQEWVRSGKSTEQDGSTGIVEDSARLSQRAVLWVDKWTVEGVEAGKIPTIQYKLINSGRTHAEIGSIFSGYAISTEDKMPPVPPYHENPTAPGIVGPNASVDVELALATPLTGKEFSDIVAGREFLYLYGRVTFRDEFEWTCDVGYGARYGYFGGGKPSIQFMNQPGYTYVRWQPPKQKTGKE